jgi:GrpB-like predicted nucleotidyltransferase (UPF0157 family)
MGTIVVVDYDPSWPELFEKLKAHVEPVLAGLAISIEHVGSTAVPGLAAKPVIDLDVVVSEGDVAEAVVRLATLGYEHLGDQGVPEREAFRAPPGAPVHHLYVCPSTSVALANHRAVRDHLRATPTDARAYGELKRQLAARYVDDADGYVEGKTSFLLAILRRNGVSEERLRDIERANRRPRPRD